MGGHLEKLIALELKVVTFRADGIIMVANLNFAFLLKAEANFQTILKLS